MQRQSMLIAVALLAGVGCKGKDKDKADPKPGSNPGSNTTPKPGSGGPTAGSNPSTGSGPTDLGSYGIACVSFPLIVDMVFPVAEDGTATAEVEIACDPALVGLVVDTQFIT